MEENKLERLKPYEKEGFEIRLCRLCQEGMSAYEGRFLYYEIQETLLCGHCAEYLLSHHSLLHAPSEESAGARLLKVLEDEKFCFHAKEIRKIQIFRDTIHEDTLRLNDGTHFAKIKGLSLYHPGAAKAITKETTLYVIREPFNEINGNAIALFIDYENSKEKVGYLPIGLCEELAPIMDQGDTINLFIEDVTTRKVRRTSYVDGGDGVYLEHYNESMSEVIVHIQNVIDDHPLYRLKRLFRS